jgi:hypothetical protein
VGAIAVGDVNGDGRPDLVTANYEAHTVSVFINRPGLCTVQDLSYMRLGETIPMTVPSARRALARANCRVGKIRRAYSDEGEPKGRVIGERPRFGAVLPEGGKVNLVVSKGRRK